MKSSSKVRNELRIVTSVDQIIPYLFDLELENNYNDDDDLYNDLEVEQYTNQIAVEDDNKQKIDKNNMNNNNLLVPLTLQPVSSEQTITASTTTINIYDEYVNFIDLSVLNPIIDGNNCQRDQLIESEISEQNCLCLFNFFVLFFVLYYGF